MTFNGHVSDNVWKLRNFKSGLSPAFIQSVLQTMCFNLNILHNILVCIPSESNSSRKKPAAAVSYYGLLVSTRYQ